jgi:hypothetical protein
MDTEQNSTEPLSPQAIIRVFDALPLRGPIPFGQIRALKEADGYDWAAAIAVGDALKAGAEPWYVLKAIARMSLARTEREIDKPGARWAIEMFDIVEQLRAERLDPSDDDVRWRLRGIIEESYGSEYVHEAGILLDAATHLVLDAEDGDVGSAEFLLQSAARELVGNAFAWAKIRKDRSIAEAKSLFQELCAALAAAPRAAQKQESEGAEQ